MKIFENRESEWDNKLNIVDKNNVLVGFDYEQSCCEDFGYFIIRENILDNLKYYKELINDGFLEEDFIRKTESLEDDLEEFIFDPTFYEEIELCDNYDYNLAMFKITNGTETRFLYLYNFHNGYYGHGFTFENNGELFYGSTL